MPQPAAKHAVDAIHQMQNNRFSLDAAFNNALGGLVFVRVPGIPLRSRPWIL